MSTKTSSLKFLKEKWEDNYAPSGYPDFRFFCPYCGSLEIYFELNETYRFPIGYCLDCNTEWFDNENDGD